MASCAAEKAIYTTQLPDDDDGVAPRHLSVEPSRPAEGDVQLGSGDTGGTHGGDILLIYRGLNYQRLIWLINLDFIGEQTYYRGNTKSTSCWE